MSWSPPPAGTGYWDHCGPSSIPYYGYILNGALAANGGAYTPIYEYGTDFGYFTVWGPGNKSGGTGTFIQPSPNVSTLAPPGADGSYSTSNKFLAVDGAYGRTILKQTVSLDTSKSYTLSFEYAGGQQFKPCLVNQGGQCGNFGVNMYLGDTLQRWNVSVGSTAITDPALAWTNLSQSFTPWRSYSYTFTPTTSTVEIAFEAIASISDGSFADSPPFLLLDNVQLLEAPPVPAPLPLLGTASAFSAARRLRRRFAAEASGRHSPDSEDH